MSYVPIFHLTVPAVWVSVLVAAAAASLLLRVMALEKAGDWYWNAVALYIITWKLSYIPFNFEHFLAMPLSLLYFNGGLYGHLLAVFLTALYLRFAKIRSDAARQAPYAWLLFFLSYQTALQSFEGNMSHAALHGLLLVLGIASVRFLSGRDDVPVPLLLASLMMVELFILSSFGPLFTWQNLTFVGFSAFTLYLHSRFEQKGQIP